MSISDCADLVRRGDPDRFLATMAAPPAARAALFVIYAFNVEVARAPWVTSEPMIAEMRLQWWRDALEEIGAGETVRAHEVTRPLAEVLDTTGAGLLDQLVQARRWDIYKDPFEDAEHFAEYLDRTAGNLTWATARALGAGELGAGDESAVRDAAWASGLANWFLAIPELESRGRVPLVDGREATVRDLAEQGLERLKTSASKAAKPALLATWRAKSLLTQVQRDPALVAAGGLSQSEFARRFSLLWQSALG